MPRGLEKKLDRGEFLPEGWQKKVKKGQILEENLERPLPPVTDATTE
ncbi:hypothetical protein [Dongshaea marina]|nr:hypothetical protein [Dongshaea marina]